MQIVRIIRSAFGGEFGTIWRINAWLVVSAPVTLAILGILVLIWRNS